MVETLLIVGIVCVVIFIFKCISTKVLLISVGVCIFLMIIFADVMVNSIVTYITNLVY